MSCTPIESVINIYLYSAVFRARRKPMTSVREGQVKDLVTVFSQCLNLHARDTVKKTSELSIPGHRRCIRKEPGLVNTTNRLLPALHCSLSVTHMGDAVQSEVCDNNYRTAPSKGTRLWRQPATACRSGQLSEQHHGAAA